MAFGKFASLALLVSVTSAPIHAQKSEIVVSARANLRSIEYDYSGDDRLQHARSMFNSLIPAGTSLTDARSTLKKSGAHCRSKSTSTETDCNYYSFEGIDDHLRDVVWTVRLDAPAGKIANVDVNRESIGS